MFTQTRTQKFTGSSLDNFRGLEILREALERAETVVIGAGAGLSAAAGLSYSGERFRENFSDFSRKYGFTDMYSGGFYPFDTAEEYWAYWSRYVYINRYECRENGVYKRLLEIVRNRDYFVLTTNVDHRFQAAGFDKKRLFYTQGDYGLFQCSVPCHSKTYDNEEIIRRMVREQEDMRIPSSLVPVCPVCGKPMAMNLRVDGSFAEDEGWLSAAGRYRDFIRRRGENTLFLELGVGFNTPGIIKYPFMKMAAADPGAFYACINRGEAFCPGELSDRSVCLDMDISKALELL